MPTAPVPQDPPSPDAQQGPWRGHAVLQVPVPALEPFVRERTAHHDPGFLGSSLVAGQQHVHAHVTALGPFDELPDQRRVARAIAAQRPFAYTLDELDCFPNGIIHAVPTPRGPFEDLTCSLRREFPDVVPYRGQFCVQPHVTLEAVAPGIDLAWVARHTRMLLPARCTARWLDLVWYEQGATRLVQRWALGGEPAGLTRGRPRSRRPAG